MSAFDAEYEPSPWEPIAEEVALYERTGGTEPSQLVGDHWIVLGRVVELISGTAADPLLFFQGQYRTLVE